MGLESPVDYLDDLDETNPLHADGLVDQDDHTRNIKKAVKQTFPGSGGAGFNRAILATEDEIDVVDGDTTPSAITVAGTDQVIVNDAGVMLQTTVDDLFTGRDIDTPAISGSPTINSGEALGYIPLATPVLLVSATAAVAMSQLDMSAVFAQAFNDGAKFAELTVHVSCTSGGSVSGFMNSIAYTNVANVATTTAMKKADSQIYANAGQFDGDREVNSFMQELDANSDFFYRFQTITGTAIGHSFAIYLDGYWV